MNLSPASARAMSGLPVLKHLVRLVMFTEFTYDDGTHKAGIKVPEIEGLGDPELEEALNTQYLERCRELYDSFVERLGKDEVTLEVLALFTNHRIVTDTEDLVVVESIETAIGASGAESVRYDNIDLKNRIILTLPGLFRNDSYVDVISENIKAQMREKTDLTEGIMYFIKGESSPDDSGFDKIEPEQTFYINEDSKLVIVFDEYEVAPGSMGIVEFVIPTEAIAELLVSDAYVK